MFTTIVDLEEKLDKLLPNGGINKHDRERYEMMLQASDLWSSAVWEASKKLESLAFTQEQIKQGFQFSESAIFVCGVHRSGTTLVRNLLDNHPALSVLPSEGTFITNQEQQLLRLPQSERCAYLCKIWLARLANSNNQAPFWLLGRTSEEYSPYVEFTRVFSAWWSIFENEIRNKNSLWPLMVLQLAYATSKNELNKKIPQIFG